MSSKSRCNVCIHAATVTVIVFFAIACCTVQGQGNSDKMIHFGPGGGIHFSDVVLLQDQANQVQFVDGNTARINYSSLIKNIGYNVFFHIEGSLNNISLALYPGVASYKYQKSLSYPVNNNLESVIYPEQLMYFSLPVEIKKKFFNNQVKPFIGARAIWQYQLYGTGAANHLMNRISAGVSTGLYLDYYYVTVVPLVYYTIGMHNITRISERSTSGANGIPFTADKLKLNDIGLSVSVLFPLSFEARKGALKCTY